MQLNHFLFCGILSFSYFSRVSCRRYSCRDASEITQHCFGDDDMTQIPSRTNHYKSQCTFFNISVNKGQLKEILDSRQRNLTTLLFCVRYLLKNLSICTLCVSAAADLCRLLQPNVHLVPTQHVARCDGCLRQVAMGGVCAAH